MHCKYYLYIHLSQWSFFFDHNIVVTQSIDLLLFSWEEWLKRLKSASNHIFWNYSFIYCWLIYSYNKQFNRKYTIYDINSYKYTLKFNNLTREVQELRVGSLALLMTYTITQCHMYSFHIFIKFPVSVCCWNNYSQYVWSYFVEHLNIHIKWKLVACQVLLYIGDIIMTRN